MEKEKQQPIVATLVATSPEQLRELANLLELSVQRTNVNETIMVKLTDKIMLSYKPPQKNPVVSKEKIITEPTSLPRIVRLEDTPPTV